MSIAVHDPPRSWSPPTRDGCPHPPARTLRIRELDDRYADSQAFYCLACNHHITRPARGLLARVRRGFVEWVHVALLMEER